MSLNKNKIKNHKMSVKKKSLTSNNVFYRYSTQEEIEKSRICEKTILLTGATGFLGSNLLRKLIEFGIKKVIIIKRSFSDTLRINDIINSKNVISYNCDESNFEDIFLHNKIGAIIHCATEYGRNKESCYKIFETNLMFPIQLLDLAIKYKVEIFINTDSYFNKDNLSYSFLRDYSLSKKCLLLCLENYSKNIKVINMRLEHMFGFNDSDNKFCKYIFNKIVAEKALSIDLTYGNQKRDFIYIDDVVESYINALIYAFSNNFRIRCFDIGTGVAVSVKDFVEYINELAGNKTKLNFGALSYREDEIMCSKADIIELENMGFRAKYTYKDGIKEMFNEYKKGLTNE